MSADSTTPALRPPRWTRAGLFSGSRRRHSFIAAAILALQFADAGTAFSQGSNHVYTSNATAAAQQSYDFEGVDTQALALYRRGWIEILEYGRWQEAERLYREALAADPGFTVAQSVLARISTDPGERDVLYRDVEARMDQVDAHARLLLTTYQRTLELFALREAGETISDSWRKAMATRAVADYGEFLQHHPGEWSVMIEYVEWVHALDGPAAALGAIAELEARNPRTVSFSYFPAWFHAELGNLKRAWELAAAFAQRIDDDTSPQPHYLHAFLHFQAGDLAAATAAIERALALDPRHLLAARLQVRIDSAR